MILSMSRQSLLFLTTIIMGMVIGFIYDIFRIFRKTTPHKNIFTQTEDLLFWLAVTFLMFYVMLNKNYGEIRLFVLLGAVLGMVMYFATLSHLIIKVSVAVIQFTKRVMVTVIRILFTPLRLLIKLLSPPAAALGRILRKNLHSVKRYAKMKARKTLKQASIIRRKV